MTIPPNFKPVFRSLGDTELPTSAPVAAYWVHFAGGTLISLVRTVRESVDDLPIEVFGCAMPAREDLSDLSFETSINEMAIAMARSIRDHRTHHQDHRPYVMIGHSFGSVLAYKITEDMMRLGDPPSRLVVLSFPAADQLTHEDSLHQLDDGALIEKVDQIFGGVPPEVLADPEVQQLFAPALRFDLGMLERYQHDSENERLSVPIIALCGTDDRAVNLAQMQRWSRMTNTEFRLRAIPGDHFFPAQRMKEVLRIATWEWLGASSSQG